MEEKILETIVIGLTKSIIDESKTLFDEIYENANDQIKQFIGKDLKNYLNKQKDKYSYIKTLLRGNTPVYLYDIYFPAKLLDEKENIYKTESSSYLFKKYNFITIIGDAGSGKSTLVKHLFLNTIYEKNSIPILIELRYLNDTQFELESFIKNTISQNKLAANEAILEKLLEKGKFTLFLDGFDEVDEKSKGKLVKQFNEFVNKYNSNSYLLTSRPYSNIENLPLFVNLKMKDLSFQDGEIKGFVYKQLATEKEIADKAIKSIEQGESAYIQSFLKNPLLLSLYLLTFQNYASIPDKKYIFYRRVINALFSEHDSKTKLGFVREKTCGLDQEGFESILKSFSILSYFENEYVFDRDYINLKLKLIKEKKEIKFDNNKFITDLKSAVSLWVDDEGMISFAHRSLQEYFTALFITELQVEEKNRVYNKIINKYELSQSNSLREIDNLLSLLKEMDEYNFIKFFYHPLLLELKNDIISQPKHSDTRKYLSFFIEGLRYNSHDDHHEFFSFHFNRIIDKTIYIHLPFTQEFYEYLSYEVNDGGIYNKYISEMDLVPNLDDEETVRTIIFDDNSFERFYNLLNEKTLKEFFKQIIKFINEQTEYCTNFLKKTDSIEKDLVDLI